MRPKTHQAQAWGGERERERACGLPKLATGGFLKPHETGYLLSIPAVEKSQTSIHTCRTCWATRPPPSRPGADFRTDKESGVSFASLIASSDAYSSNDTTV